MKRLKPREENQIISELILKKLQETQSGQWFYSVIHYGDWDDNGNLLEWDKRKWFYREDYIKGVHKRLRRTLREHLGKDIIQYFTLERHQDRYEKIKTGTYIQNGNVMKGKYHSNIILGPFSNHKVESPRSKLKRLFNTQGRMGKTISQTNYNNQDELKIDLLNSIIRLHPDVSRYGPSVHTQMIRGKYGVESVGHYSIKDITKKGLDFTEVLDWDNSDITKEVK